MIPIDFKDERGEAKFKELVKNLPDNIEVYLIAGSVRNAIHRHFHSGDNLEQRDYDQIVTLGSEDYLQFLESLNFYNGLIQRETQKVKIHNFNNSDVPQDFANNLVFDIHLAEGTSPLENLKNHASLTVNGNAISIRHIFDDDWIDKLVSLPGAVESIRDKKLRINPDGYKHQAANLFSIIRFVHNGYSPPPKEEVDLLIAELPRVEDDRYLKNVEKVYKYVGGEQNARRIAQDVGIEFDIFDKSALIDWLASR